MDPQQTVERPDDDAALALFFEDVGHHQYGLNRDAARRAAALADALRFAREHPWVYALAGDPEPERTAERCAVIEASARFQLADSAVRGLACAADEARKSLPALWARAWEGYASLTQIESAVALLPRFEGGRAALGEFDAALADLVLTASPASFRAKATTLARRLAPTEPAAEHAAAFAQRRVVVEPGDAGMSWIHAHVSTVDALAIKRRLTSTAKHLQKSARDGRSRDQVRADLLTGWLRGVGTPTAVKTKVFVTVPLDTLGPRARGSVRADLPVHPGAPDLNAEPRVLGSDDPVDAVTAVRLLLEAGTFTRVITDPVTGVVLDMDRRARNVTRAQREWLMVTHGTCTRDDCRRHAVETEIDHWDEFRGPKRGPTNIGNLHPFCAPDHKTKGTTRFRYRRRPDGSVQLQSPTGFRTRPDADPPYRPVLDRLLADAPVYGEPPF